MTKFLIKERRHTIGARRLGRVYLEECTFYFFNYVQLQEGAIRVSNNYRIHLFKNLVHSIQMSYGKEILEIGLCYLGYLACISASFPHIIK